jgi:hypothetical protein
MHHNNRPFTTYDRDNDSHSSTNCAAANSNSPFWYVSCWSGSINGWGEQLDGTNNGSYWTSSAAGWGTDNGQGAGNGWMFVK